MRPVNELIQGDALSVLQGLPDNYVQCCITSPPYFGLRDYGVAGQIGLEESPEAYIARLVEVFAEVRRILRHDGTLWVNIGDSYHLGNGTITRGKQHLDQLGARLGTGGGHKVSNGTGGELVRRRCEGLKPKDLIGIPWMLAFALRSDGWYLRSDIIWHKPTAMPESVTDRPTSAHEHMFLLAKRERYFYDADAIREPLKPKTSPTFGIHPTSSEGNDARGKVKSDNWKRTTQGRRPRSAADGSIAGANKRNVWTVASKPYPESHFATFPPKLIEPCVLAGTSPYACEMCKAPWKRMTETTGGGTWEERKAAGAPMRYGTQSSKGTPVNTMGRTQRHTTGWHPTCSCSNEGSGKCLVLDPFMGAGTTALVALQQGRDYLGIELNPAYIKLATERIAQIQPVLWAAGVV